MMQKSKIHYAWLILAACCAIQASSIGIIMNSAGVFFPHVADDLQVGVGSISLYITIFY